MPRLNSISQEQLEIHFTGQISQVDVNTLINSLVNFSTVIQQVNQELGPEKAIEVKIQPFEPGSFIIKAALIEAAKGAMPLLSGVTDHISKVIEILVNLFTLRKFLQGEKPKSIQESGDKVTVENTHGDTIVILGSVYQIYQNNRVVSEAISKNFETLQEDETIEGYEIKQNEKIIFQASRQDFVPLARKQDVHNDNIRSIVRENTVLNIVKLVFQEDNKWSFLYDGNKISAFISDDSFFQKIDEGLRFAKGDTLLVDLKIRQVYDSTVDGYLNDSFEIVSVKQHIPRPQQKSLLL